MLQRQRLSGLLSLILSFSLIACVTTHQESHPEDFTNTESIFWELSKGKEQHFLMGTLHVGVGLLDLPQSVLARLGAAELFVGELSSLDFDPELMQQYTFLPEGQTLSQILGADYVKRFVRLLDEAGFPYDPSLIERLSLYSVYTSLLTISTRQINEEEGEPQASDLPRYQQTEEVHPLVKHIDESELPIDLKLAALAGNQGIQIRGFESIKDQLDMFQRFCTPDKVQDLIKYQDETKDLIQSLTTAYQSSAQEATEGEQDPFAALMIAMLQSMSRPDRELLLYERNIKWINDFDAITKGRNSFIAVGAGHLPGAEGMVALLRQRGYEVRPAFFQTSNSDSSAQVSP